jgi:GNAT superfamily N-acetyltransferase
MNACHARIIDITETSSYQQCLYRCIVGPPSKQCRRRVNYIDHAVKQGLHKKILLWKRNVVGQIEYSPADVSYYPITGKNIVVMNCIWVLRKARGHNLGKQLLQNMLESEKQASGFATIALENHPSPWFKKDQLEKLGFKPLDSVTVTHKIKGKQSFKIHLMWKPINPNAKPPTWNKEKLLEGTKSCTAHPLYHPQTYKDKDILQRTDTC